MALRGPFMPKGLTEIQPAAPQPLVAVAGEPAGDRFGGEIVSRLGGADPKPVVIMVGDENLLAIIADLTTRIEALEP